MKGASASARRTGTGIKKGKREGELGCPDIYMGCL